MCGVALSLRKSLLAAFLLPTLLILTAAGIAGYVFVRDVLEEQLGEGLSSVAASAASQISGERMLTIEPEDDVHGTRTWRNLVAMLGEVRDASGMRRVFAVDRQGRVRADTGRRIERDAEAGAEAGAIVPVGMELPELARDRLELERVFSGSRAASQVLFLGHDGQLYKTGFAPIYAGEELVGAVGVEGTAAFFRPLQRLARGALVVAAFALILSGLIALLTARMITRPLRQLMASALRISEGDLQTPVSPAPTLEIGFLARELEAMRHALESRDRQLKMMLAGVAHEVKNPLGGIELFGGLLSEELAAPPVDVPPEALAEAKSHLSRILDEVAYLRRIVDDFLTFARDQRLQKVETSLTELARHVRSHVEAEAQEKGVGVEVDVPSAQLCVDPSLLTAALVNLVKNAVQAAPAGSTVRLSGEAGGAGVQLFVTDAGEGIPGEKQERVFEAFFTTRQKGTGLGLPLARKIVEAHGGSLTLRSEPGRTEFTLKLPAHALGSPREAESPTGS